LTMIGTMACVDQNPSVSDESFRTAQDAPPDPGDSEGAITVTQDCVYIQWCDEPPMGGTWKVVGKVRPACFSQGWNDAIFDEFYGDAQAVCGKHSLDDSLWRIDCF